MTTAAEGVDARDQQGALLMAGCDQGQGDLLGGPLDAGGAAALLDRGTHAASRERP